MSGPPAEAPASGLHWNAGGWFGGQVGSTLWMALLGALTLPRHPGAGALVLGLALAANAVGVLLWRRRERLAPHPAVQILLAVCGLAALASVLVLKSAGSVYSNQIWMAPLTYPAVMLLVYSIHRANRGRG